MENIKLKHLITTGGKDAELIKALLEDSGIEVIIRHEETGGYTSILMGFSSYNIEIYTSEEQYEEAVEILDELNIDDQAEDSREDIIREDEKERMEDSLEDDYFKDDHSRAKEKNEVEKIEDYNGVEETEEYDNGREISYYLAVGAKVIIILYILYLLLSRWR